MKLTEQNKLDLKVLIDHTEKDMFYSKLRFGTYLNDYDKLKQKDLKATRNALKVLTQLIEGK
jgi:hypothetical protein